MRIGLYIGSFNPFHNGHLKVVNFLITKDYVDKIIIIPTDSYWDKVISVSRKIRFEMLSKIKTSLIDVSYDLGEAEYTYEIINNARKKYLNADLYLIISADNLPNFHKWKNVSQILKNKVIVLQRDNIDMESVISKSLDRSKFILVNDFKNIPISSTYIRSLTDKKLLYKYLPIEIYNYIIDNKLYGFERWVK